MHRAIFALALLYSTTAAAYTVKHTSTGATVRWTTARLDVQVHASMGSMMTLPEVQRAASIAVDAWSGLGGPELALDPVVDGAPYVAGARGVQIVALDPWPYDPALLAVTRTSYSDGDGRIVDADILVNPRQLFALSDENAPDTARYDLAAVLAHEMGHALGLDESETDESATMWPSIGRGDVHQRTLSADDEAGLAEVYRGAVLAPPAGCGRASVAGSGNAGWGAIVLVALTLVAGKISRSRRRR
jgi:hypothetical protein